MQELFVQFEGAAAAGDETRVPQAQNLRIWTPWGDRYHFYSFVTQRWEERPPTDYP